MSKGKCVFNKNLQQTYPFLKQLEDASDLHCLKCFGRFSISSGGRADIRRHLKTKKHQKSVGATLPSANNGSFYNDLSKKKPKTKEIEICRKPKTMEIEMCRICSKFTNGSSAINLFQENQHNLLAQIKDLTDCSLSNESDLPKYICRDCEEDLKKAHSFRRRCLDTQSYFTSEEYKERLNQKYSARIKKLNEDKCVKPEKLEEVLIDVKEEVISTDIDEKDVLEIPNKHQNISSEVSLFIKSELECFSNINIKKKNKNKSSADTDSVNQSEAHTSVNDSMNIHNFICDRCGNHFTQRRHLNVHLIRHTNIKPFKCEICPKKYFTSSELKRHMRHHTGERPFACKYCQRRFTDYSTRVQHERTHRNERPYRCSQCGKSFNKTCHLKNHMLVHTGERSFKCYVCNKDYQRQNNLKVHFRSATHKKMLEKHLLQGINSIKFINIQNFFNGNP